VKVVVDPKSALYVTGSELDYVDALQDGGFKVKNPNAATTCSCGESFSA
jgi:iron-sulfur cluster assembly protein